VANSKIALPTSARTARRSIAWDGLRNGGHPKSRGATDHSLASSSGTATMPTVTCRPWLSAYSHDGEAGHPKPNGCGPPGAISALRPSAGW
jgi:hypothetical protein